MKVFNQEMLQSCLEIITSDQPTFVIGVDTYDKDNCAYCVFRNTKNLSEVIFGKSRIDEKQLNEEVENIAKYFNASILR